MRYGVVQLPILGEGSILVAMASECAAEQDKFWGYHDQVYERARAENFGVYTGPGLLALAEDLRLDLDQFTSCVTEGRPLDQLRTDWQSAVALGVGSTPTIFINDVLYGGPRTFESMSAHIEDLLAKQ